MSAILETKKQIEENLSALNLDPEELSATARIILEHVSAMSFSELIVRGWQPDDKQATQIAQIVQARLGGMPLQYVLRSAYFCGMDLYVENGVLIPRPETEILVEEVSKIITSSKNTYHTFLDIGIGSGAITLALLSRFANLQAVGVDVSPTAIAVSAKNAEKFDLSKRLELHCGDWRDFVLGQRFDFIVSNPPYIPRAMKEALQKEVRLFEPDLALFVDDQLGLEFYEAFSKSLKSNLNPGGFVAFELGAGQAQYVLELFSDWQNCNLVEDLSGIARVFTASSG